MTELRGAAFLGITGALLNVDMNLKHFPKAEEVKAIEADKYYPLELYNDLVNFLEDRYNEFVMRKLGKSVGKAVVEESIKPQNPQSAIEAINLVQGAHEYFCNPTVGEFKIAEQKENFIKVEYTAPYNCILQEGLLITIAETFGGKFAKINHDHCKREGKSECIYEISYQ